MPPNAPGWAIAHLDERVSALCRPAMGADPEDVASYFINSSSTYQ